MRTRVVECTGFTPTPAGLCISYATRGTASGPGDALAFIDIAESSEDVTVTVHEAVSDGDKLLMRVSACVEIALNKPIADRVVRDGGRRRSPVVPRRDRRPGDHCQEWIGAPTTILAGGRQAWPHGTEHRRLHAPGSPP